MFNQNYFDIGSSVIKSLSPDFPVLGILYYEKESHALERLFYYPFKDKIAINYYLLAYSSLRSNIISTYNLKDHFSEKQNKEKELKKELEQLLCGENSTVNSKAPFYLMDEDKKLLNLKEDLSSRNIKAISVYLSKKLKDSDMKLNTSASLNVKNITEVISKNAKQNYNNIYKCFDMFMTEERLDKMNTWYCKKCKDSKEAMIKMVLYKLPPVLIVHLKRFKHIKGSSRGWYRGGDEYAKNGNFIDFPIEGLNLKDYVPESACETGKPVYDLYGIVNHYGSTGGGHYTAFCKNPISKKWYEYDDSRVRQVNPERIISDNAYVLFYKQKNHSSLSSGSTLTRDTLSRDN